MNRDYWLIYACNEGGFWFCNRSWYGLKELDRALEDAALMQSQDKEAVYTVVETWRGL